MDMRFLCRSTRPVLAGALIALTAAAALPAAADAARRPRLLAFDSCRALVGYAHANAARAGGGVGVPVRAVAGAPMPLAAPVSPVTTAAPGAKDQSSTETAAPAPAAAPTGGDTPTFSTTNVQEAGIDEPDIIKTDGRHIFAIREGVLRIVDVTGDAPRLVGTLKLEGGYDHQLLLRGPRVLVLSTVSAPIAVDVAEPTVGPAPAAAPRIAPVPGPGGGPRTLLTEVDVSDPAAPKVARTMTLDGAYVDARMTGGTVRVVVSSTPQPTGAVPLTSAALRTFVPATTIRSRISGRTFRRGVVSCGDVRRPDVFSGLDLLTVLTVDLDKGLYSVDRDAIMAGAQTVYGSASSLYVASQRYVRGLQDTSDVPDAMRTEIHRFDATDDGQTTYAGSGTVPGFVVNQFALSEQDGALRVASTDEPAWLPDGRQPEPAQSYVTVLAKQAGGLAQVGQVGGLGKGQKIYAVRFVGDKGYVVTFRRIDPLYTLDLSAPAAPKVAGELELSGYSAYLHPISDTLLLGIGQEASDAGRPTGTQVSLFDVGDLAHPKRLQHVVFGSGSSDAEYDHHAFLYWNPTGLALLPLQLPPTDDKGTGAFVGAVGLHVAADGLTEVGRIVHGGDQDVAPIGRSLVVGDRVYTLSWLGLAASRLDTLAPVAFVRFDA
jgi:uncharacterized secreted protein with C-terminal beta-propeller domain